MSATTIYVTRGETKYVGGTITETTGKDISGDSITLALGPYSPPPTQGTGVSPDSDQPGISPASRVVKLLIGNGYQPATGLYVWAWVTDSPEQEPLRLPGGPYNIA